MDGLILYGYKISIAYHKHKTYFEFSFRIIITIISKNF